MPALHSALSRATRLTASALAGIAGAAVLAAGAAPAASATEGPEVDTNGGLTLKVRSAPSVSADILERLPDGAGVDVDCRTDGDAAVGRSGATDTWYRLGGGGWVHAGWVADTGSVAECDASERASRSKDARTAPEDAAAPDSALRWEGLTAEQRDNARTIVATARHDGYGNNATVIALMAAMQESSLRNLSYGDRDSVGLFQQRPSQAWGSVDELTDPVQSTRLFLGTGGGVNPGLSDIAWTSASKNDAAQTVQRSAHPGEYGKWEKLAWDILDHA